MFQIVEPRLWARKWSSSETSCFDGELPFSLVELTDSGPPQVPTWASQHGITVAHPEGGPCRSQGATAPAAVAAGSTASGLQGSGFWHRSDCLGKMVSLFKGKGLFIGPTVIDESLVKPLMAMGIQPNKWVDERPNEDFDGCAPGFRPHSHIHSDIIFVVCP